jgi:hypothetical protein
MRTALALAACLAWPASAAAQVLLDDYARVVTILNYASAYVGESLLACTEKGFLTDAEAQGRFTAYQERNAAMIRRAEDWKKRADARFEERGELAAAREHAQQAGMSAVAGALIYAQKEMGAAPDPRALCTARLAAIEAGRYDVAGHAELTRLLER